MNAREHAWRSAAAKAANREPTSPITLVDTKPVEETWKSLSSLLRDIQRNARIINETKSDPGTPVRSGNNPL